MLTFRDLFEQQEKGFGAPDWRPEGDGRRVGLFSPLPGELADRFPDLSPRDDSPSHMTFLYVGEVAAGRREEFMSICRDVLSSGRPGTVRLDEFGGFPPERRWKQIAEAAPLAFSSLCRRFVESAEEYSVHMTVDVPAHLRRLRQELVDRLRAVGFALQGVDSWTPHVTLAYPPGGEQYTGPKPQGSWTVRELEVWGLPTWETFHFRGEEVEKGGRELWFSDLLNWIEKGAGHKYIARYPTGNPDRPYRYIYDRGHTARHNDNIEPGAKFRDHHDMEEQAGHWHVVSAGEDNEGPFVLEHDETGERREFEDAYELRQWVNELHSEVTGAGPLPDDSALERGRHRWLTREEIQENILAGGFDYKAGKVRYATREEAMEAVRTFAEQGPVHIHLDVGGEGRYPEAINANYWVLQSGRTEAQPIPNLVLADTEEELPFDDDCVDFLTIESAPCVPSEAFRIVKPGGEIQILHPEQPAGSMPELHQEMVKLARGEVEVEIYKDRVEGFDLEVTMYQTTIQVTEG